MRKNKLSHLHLTAKSLLLCLKRQTPLCVQRQTILHMLTATITTTVKKPYTV